jgi:hypothetical protein
MDGIKEKGNWNCRARLLKYAEDIKPYAQDGKENDFHELFKPYEVIEMEGNCLLNTGIDEMWDLITGVETTDVFDNTYATIGVGDDDTAAAASQTDLQASTNKDYQGMESGYPTSTSQKVTFKASWDTDHGNYAWEEWVVKQSTSGICLNRKVESLGTKSSGTWTLEVDITLS